MLEHDLVRVQIEKLRGRTRRLDDAVHRASAGGAPSEPGAFREIQAALEELQVAQEELNVSNESLAEAQRELEVERQRYVACSSPPPTPTS
jgi:outer membrane protein TolC